MAHADIAIICLTLACGGFGCGASTPDEPDAGREHSDIPICQERAQLLVEALSDCCSDEDDQTDHVDTRVAQCEEDHSNERVGFDPAMEAECTALLVADWNRCVDPWNSQHDLSPCEVRVPMVDLGAPCADTRECREGQCLGGNCTRPPGIGLPCTAEGVCADQAVCQCDEPGCFEEGGPATCVARIPAGSPCLGHHDLEPCALGSHCDSESGTCEREIAAGEPCGPDDWCAGNTQCSGGTCQVVPTVDLEICWTF